MAAFGRYSKDTLLSDITGDPNATLGDLMNALDESGYHIGGGRHSNGLIGTLEKIKDTLITIDRTLMEIAEPWAKADEAASKYAKTIGLTKKGMEDLRRSALNNSITQHIGFDFDMSADELIEAQMRYAQSVGRTIKGSVEDQRNLAAIKKIFGESSTEILTDFEKFGLSISSSGEHLGKMYSDASKNGITLEKYAKNVQQGLAMAQTYTFRGGLKGMEEMAKRAAAIRMDMSQISAFADSFSDIEKAVQNSAKLQVLGGPFASGADALGLLNDSLNGVEDVQKRMEQFTKGMATFNKATGEVEVSQFNKMRLKAYAEATGQDYSKLMENVNRQGAIEEIKSQMAVSRNVSSFDKDMRELIQNTATFKDGKAGVTIDGKFKTLDEITDKDRDALIAQSRTDSENIQSIAKDVRSLKDLRSGVRKEYENVKARTTGTVVGNAAKWGTQTFANGGMGLFKGKLGESLRGIGQWVSTGILGLFGLGSALTILGGGVGRIKNIWTRGGGLFSSSRIGEGLRSSSNIGSKLGDITGSSSRIAKGGRGIKNLSKLKDGTKILSKVGKSYTVQGGRLVNAAGKKLSSTAADMVLKTGTKATSKVAKGGLGRTLTRVGIKAGGKVGGKLMAGLAKGGPLGIVGAVGNIATDMLVDAGKIKKGGGAHAAMKMGSSALEGAALGMMLGPVGAAVGAVAGAAIGAVKIAKIRNEQVIDAQLGKLGIERQGNYSAGRLSKIDKALRTGKMSNATRRKLLRKGDAAIVEQIEAVKQQKDAEKEAKREKRLERRDKRLEAKAQISKSKFGTAHFEIGTAYFGGKGIGNGERKGGGAERVRKAAKKMLGVSAALTPIGAAMVTINGIRGKAEKGESQEMSILKKIHRGNLRGEDTKSTQSFGPMDVNINGTIKLETPNGQSIDLMKEIKNNPQLMSQLTEMIIKEMNRRTYGAYVEGKTRGDNFV